MNLVILNNGSEVIVNSASQFPEIYKECYEPMVIANIILPSSCLGNILSLCEVSKILSSKILKFNSKTLLGTKRRTIGIVKCGCYSYENKI